MLDRILRDNMLFSDYEMAIKFLNENDLIHKIEKAIDDSDYSSEVPECDCANTDDLEEEIEELKDKLVTIRQIAKT